MNSMACEISAVTETSESKNKGPDALKDFKFQAAIDWVWICIKLSSPSQFRHVQERMRATFGKLFVEANENEASSLNFSFKIQDPKGPDQLMRDLQSAVRPGDPPLTEDHVTILGIELAIDAYHRSGNSSALAPAVFHFFLHHALPPAGPPRITEPKHFHVPGTRREIRAALVDGFTIHGGPKGVDHASHFYVKMSDTIDGVKYDQLPEKLWRARFENTWTNESTPFKTIAEWRTFKFESLSTKFALVVPTAPEGLALLVQDRKIQLGTSPDAPRIRPSDRRKRAAFTRRDTITNDRVRQALRALTRHQCCENSVKNTLEIPTSPEGRCALEALSPKYLNSNTFTSKHTSQQSFLTKEKSEEEASSQGETIHQKLKQEHKEFSHHPNQCGPPLDTEDNFRLKTFPTSVPPEKESLLKVGYRYLKGRYETKKNTNSRRV